MMGFPLEYWLLVALVVVIVVNVWLAARAARRGLPYLFDPGAHSRVSVGAHGITLREGGRENTLAWPEITAVRVRTTAEGPGAEDLFLELDTTTGSRTLTIPSEAKGFDRLLQSIGGHLSGFDMEGVVEAMTCGEGVEVLVWESGGEPR